MQQLSVWRSAAGATDPAVSGQEGGSGAGVRAGGSSSTNKPLTFNERRKPSEAAPGSRWPVFPCTLHAEALTRGPARTHRCLPPSLARLTCPASPSLPIHPDPLYLVLTNPAVELTFPTLPSLPHLPYPTLTT